ncbi:unnamed protein product [Echinostoma caproni]|uniref:SET domain-containing protein n=1 Tax=Echinostoma caproni TaxID=27848 RepID=A0A183B3B0_9TREM|nr:unnamed protein product [Echinostoma caproni]
MASVVTQQPLSDILKQEPQQWDDSRPEFCSTPRSRAHHSLCLHRVDSVNHTSGDEETSTKPIPYTPKLRQTQLNLSVFRDDESTVAMVGELNFNYTVQPDDKNISVAYKTSDEIEYNPLLESIDHHDSSRVMKQTVLTSDLSLTDHPVAKETTRRQKKPAAEKKSQRGARNRSVESRASGTLLPVVRPRPRVKAVSLSPKKGPVPVTTEPDEKPERRTKRQTQLTTYGIRRTARQFHKDQEVTESAAHIGTSSRLVIGQKWCVDATKETPRLGRLINHSRLHPNCHVKVIPLDGMPRLVLFARQTINPGKCFPLANRALPNR